MTTAAKDFRPPWATTIWCDFYAIYIEIPTKAGPYIHKFSLTDNGLNKALHFLKTVHKVSPHREARANGKPKELQAHALIKRREPKPQATTEQRIKVREMLRRKGLI
jgi:hypothetical protein